MSTIVKIKLIITGGMLVLAAALLLSDRALPGSTIYDLKRLQEKIFMAIKTNPGDKIKYYNLLLDKRLNELVAIVEDGQYDYIYTSSLRYSTTAGRLTELIISSQMNDSIPEVQKIFKEHQRIIQKQANAFPNDNNDQGKFIQDGYNYLEIYLGQLADAGSK